MDPIDVVFVALLIFGYALVSRWTTRHWISGPMFFTIAGVLTGLAGFEIVDESFTGPGLELLAELTLVILLFSDATRIDLAKLESQRQLPIRLLGIGLPLTVGLGFGLAALILPALPLGVAAVMAAALSPTDAALGQAVVSDKRVPVRIRQALNVESGLNDGLMAPMVTIFIGIAGSEEGRPRDWGVLVGEQIGFGILVGAGFGIAGALLMNQVAARRWMDKTMQQLAIVGLAVATYAFALAIGGNGFVAAFLAGMIFGHLATSDRTLMTEFAEDEGSLLTFLTFFFWALKVVTPALDDLTLRIALYVVASLTIVRMVPVAIAVSWLKLRTPTVLFLGWFGPRGLASILFGFSALEELGDVDGMDLAMTTITWTVFASVILHGLSAVPAATAYGDWFHRTKDTDDGIAEAVQVTSMPVRHSHHVD